MKCHLRLFAIEGPPSGLSMLVNRFACLQQVMDRFNTRSADLPSEPTRTEEQAFVALHSPRETFATAANLETSVSYLRSTLASEHATQPSKSFTSAKAEGVEDMVA